MRWTGGFSALSLGRLIEQNHVQQRLVHPDAAVVFEKAELAESDS